MGKFDNLLDITYTLLQQCEGKLGEYYKAKFEQGIDADRWESVLDVFCSCCRLISKILENLWSRLDAMKINVYRT